MREKITACITTFNEEQNVVRCLSSVTWCDEIVVVDSFSTDRTVDLCRGFTERVHQHEWLGYVGQKHVIRKLASNPWLLFLDADEEVSPALRDEILKEMELNNGQWAGYRFPRMVNYLGKWIRHGEWYPDHKIRLFLKEKGISGGQEPHDQIFVNGPVKTLRSPLWHYTYDSIHDHLETMNRFSSITAEEKFKDGALYNWLDFLVRPPLRFIKAYILRLGFLDGKRGFLIAATSSFGVCAKYAKLWELYLRKKQAADAVRRPTK